MAFDIYPNSGDEPITLLASGSGSDAVHDDAFDSTEDTLVYIRIAMWPGSGTPPAPRIELNFDDSGYEILDVDDTYFLDPSEDGFDPSTSYGRAKLKSVVGYVYLIELEVIRGGDTWDLRLTNLDPASEHALTWFISNDEVETLQPWIDAYPDPATDLVFGDDKTVLTGHTAKKTIKVQNFGTTDLVLGPADLNWPQIDGGDPFMVEEVTVESTVHTTSSGGTLAPVTIPPGQIAYAVVRFAAPSLSGIYDPVWSVPSNDTLANPASSQHRNSLSLSGQSGRVELRLLLDASGSMAWSPDGDPDVPANEARWKKLTDAVKGFLDVLGDFGENVGDFGISIFPDITDPSFPASVAPTVGKVFVNATDITLANIASAKTALDTIAPVAHRGGTPMGEGLSVVLGEAAGDYGTFSGGGDDVVYNSRWLSLFSDGEHNAGTQTPEAFCDDGADGVASFVTKNVKVLTIGYGIEGSSHVNHSRLQNLSACSAGPDDDSTDWFRTASADPTGNQLFETLQQNLQTAFWLNGIDDPEVFLSAARPELRREFTISRYDEQVSVAVFWGTRDPEAVQVCLEGPQGQQIGVAQRRAHSEEIRRHDGERYRIFTLMPRYLHGGRQVREQRFGTWTLIVTAPQHDRRRGEHVGYHIMTRSALTATARLDKPKYYAGDAMKLSVHLAANGRGIGHAAVRARVTVPRNNLENFLAGNYAPRAALERAARVLAGTDTTAKRVKAHALAAGGLRFVPATESRDVQLHDTQGNGLYETTLQPYTVPGTYRIHIQVDGEAIDGSRFHREQVLSVQYGVRPHPRHTLIDSTYRSVVHHGLTFNVAELRIHPRDQFGNVLYVDPTIDPTLAVRVEAGALIHGPLQADLNGGYRTAVLYPQMRPARVALQLEDGTSLKRYSLVSPAGMEFADTVVDFRRGYEVEPGINRQSNPEAALGHVLTRERDTALSLSARGQVTLGFGQGPVTARSVTVFVQPDEELRPYRAEALVSRTRDRRHRPQWIRVGDAPGTTQTFGLPGRGRLWMWAVRIQDLEPTSARYRDGRPSATPGVSIIGVGLDRGRIRYPQNRADTRTFLDTLLASEADLVAVLLGERPHAVYESTRDLSLRSPGDSDPDPDPS